MYDPMFIEKIRGIKFTPKFPIRLVFVKNMVGKCEMTGKYTVGGEGLKTEVDSSMVQNNFPCRFYISACRKYLRVKMMWSVDTTTSCYMWN